MSYYTVCYKGMPDVSSFAIWICTHGFPEDFRNDCCNDVQIAARNLAQRCICEDLFDEWLEFNWARVDSE